MKYRKKPIEIEAIQWNGTALNLNEIPAWFAYALQNDIIKRGNTNREYLYITTREGTMIANPKDFIIRGVKGEIYPCKPDIFAETYEATE